MKLEHLHLILSVPQDHNSLFHLVRSQQSVPSQQFRRLHPHLPGKKHSNSPWKPNFLRHADSLHATSKKGIVGEAKKAELQGKRSTSIIHIHHAYATFLCVKKGGDCSLTSPSYHPVSSSGKGDRGGGSTRSIKYK